MAKPEGLNMRKSRQNQMTDGRKATQKTLRVMKRAPKSAVALKQEAFNAMSAEDVIKARIAANAKKVVEDAIKAEAKQKAFVAKALKKAGKKRNGNITTSMLNAIVDMTTTRNQFASRLCDSDCETLHTKVGVKVATASMISFRVTAIQYPERDYKTANGNDTYDVEIIERLKELGLLK